MANYRIEQLDAIPSVPCPCGFTRRAFATEDNEVATVHLLDVARDNRTHYHKRMTEIYVVLEGEGEIALDGPRVAVRPLTAIFIQPGCRHRAIGKMQILVIPVPAFDSADEFFDPLHITH